MSKIWAERLVAVAMILFATFFIYESSGWPGSSADFPRFTEYVIILLALIMIARTFITRDAKLAGEVQFDFSYSAIKPVYAMILAAFYGYAIFRIGFYTSSVVFFFLLTLLTGIRSWKVMGGVAVVLFPLMYFFFTIALEAELPQGLLI